jgi:hypothetical protein
MYQFQHISFQGTLKIKWTILYEPVVNQICKILFVLNAEYRQAPFLGKPFLRPRSINYRKVEKHLSPFGVFSKRKVSRNGFRSRFSDAKATVLPFEIERLKIMALKVLKFTIKCSKAPSCLKK